ncbi:hypothetical protein JKP88DRAFT_215700 [Tribonema minus]|uniref:Uncharacterized protein n=1 Tax=Tribonema minus TaxID=303371 RepID=A0A836C9Y5_9STRA|nr:hypothetical protein JKP88DRAFT_215700 [Tribonema minus]
MGVLRLGVGIAAAVGVCYGFVPSGSFQTSFFSQTNVAQPLCKATAAQSQSRLSMMAGQGGKILVSGFLDAKERTDQFVFDVLHAQSSWSKIVAFSPSTAFAKKRLISRTSRYSGLLDILEFDEGDHCDGAVMAEKLQGVDAWLCFGCAADKVAALVDVAKASGIKSLVMLATMSAADAKANGVLEKFESAGMRFTFIRVGEIAEGKESGAITTTELTEDLPMESVLREDAVRVAAEAFRIDAAANKAFALGKGDEAALEFLKTLREQGKDRVEELTSLLEGGVATYVSGKAKPAEEVAQETDEEKAARKAKLAEERKVEFAEIMKKSQERFEREQKERVETEAKKILTREWRSNYWRRNATLTEEEYIADPEKWAKAMARATKIVASETKSGLFGDADVDDDDDGDDETHWREPRDEEEEEETKDPVPVGEGSDSKE